MVIAAANYRYDAWHVHAHVKQDTHSICTEADKLLAGITVKPCVQTLCPHIGRVLWRVV